MKQRLSLMLAIVASVLFIACGTIGGGLPDLGDILGSGSPQQQSDVRGFVERVDTSNRAIILDVNYINQLRDERQDAVVYYDNDTVVEYQGRTYAVTDLERGDEVSIVGSNVGGRYVADRITVLRDVSR